MKVNICRAYIVVRDKEEKLTKSIAKQIPVIANERWDHAVIGVSHPEPLGKVSGRVLGEVYSWLYLIVDELGNLEWHPPVVPSASIRRTILGRGGWIDDPDTVPTIIL